MLLPLIVLLLLRFAGVKFAHEYIVLMDRAHKLQLDNVMVFGGNDVQSWCRCCFFSSSLTLLSPSSLKFSLLLSMWSFVFRHTTCTPRLCVTNLVPMPTGIRLNRCDSCFGCISQLFCTLNDRCVDFAARAWGTTCGFGAISWCVAGTDGGVTGN